MIHRKTSEELLGGSIIELFRNKPLDKITVKEIAENCGLSSATFYRNFQDKYELISRSITEWFLNGYPSEMDQPAEYLYNSMPTKLKEFLQ